MAPRKTDPYVYEDTRRLVTFVESAAALIEQKGTAAFTEFDAPQSKWRTSPTYLFVYDAGGTCVWHGLNRELVGKNLLSLRDALGKPVVEMVTAIATRPARDAADWIFDFWEERVEFSPSWKSSYVRKAIAPDGEVYLIGSGSSTIKCEKVFLQNAVDAGAQLLEERGPRRGIQRAQRTQLPISVSRQLHLRARRPRTIPDRPGVSDDHRPRHVRLPRRDRPSGRAGAADSTEDTRQRVDPVPVAAAGRDGAVAKADVRAEGEVGGETLLIGSDFFVATPVWMRV